MVSIQPDGGHTGIKMVANPEKFGHRSVAFPPFLYVFKGILVFFLYTNNIKF